MVSGKLFPRIQDAGIRDAITGRLMGINVLIPTIYTLFKDLRFLRPAVMAVRW
jgi:hypothetical protein